MRKVPITHKARLRKWQAPTRRPMSNPKQIRKGASGGEGVLLCLAVFQLWRSHSSRVISFNDSLECTPDLHPRHPRRLVAGAVRRDELSVRTTATRQL